MRYCCEDAPWTGERNVNLNKNTSENAALNKMFKPDERAPCFIFNQNKSQDLSPQNNTGMLYTFIQKQSN